MLDVPFIRGRASLTALCLLVAATREGDFPMAATSVLYWHEPCDGAASDIEAFSLQLSPDFLHATDLEVLVEHPANLGFHGNITPFAGR